MKSYFCQTNTDKNLLFPISAGLDYPGIGPEQHLHDIGRQVCGNNNEEAAAFEYLSGLKAIPAIESAHAIAYNESGAKAWINRC